jgi:hypothetical protein
MLPLRTATVLRVLLVSSVLAFLGPIVLAALPASPPPPARYQVELRFRINAARTERLQQFLAMMKFFDSLGFEHDPEQEIEPEDPALTRIRGTIASANALKLLGDRHVKSLLLIPVGAKLPEDETKPIKVQLELIAGFRPAAQLVLAEEVRARLAKLGFHESVGYDHRGQTRLVGTIPAKELETLLKDLREDPMGKLATNLPAPLRDVSPILVTEVIEREGTPPNKEPAAPPEVPKEQENLLKINPELRIFPEGDVKNERMEIILNYNPPVGDDTWRRQLTGAAPSLALEGRLGPIITGLASPREAPALADLSIVSVVRRPRPALSSVRIAGADRDKDFDAGRVSGLDRLHAQGRRGQGVRIAVIDADFRGRNRLPATTRYIDLTAARNPDIQPDPPAAEPMGLGTGTQCALAVLRAAPEAQLILLRVDAAAPHQVAGIARWIKGERWESESARRRAQELIDETDRLRLLRRTLDRERQEYLENFGQGDRAHRAENRLKKPEELEKEAQERREALEKKEGDLLVLELAQRRRLERYHQLRDDLFSLANIPIVTSSLVWNEGYPLGGNNGLERFLEDDPLPATLWFQAAGNTRGQTWTGPFRDTDGNGVMEFAPPEVGLTAARWTAEMNFLGWQPHEQKGTPELPQKAHVRVSIQWREPHDDRVARTGMDFYRTPLANLRLLILRQRDPSGTKLPADDLEVTAQSGGWPQRLDNQPGSATYEQSVEWTIETAGRYALRVEGRVPPGIRPQQVATLPGMERAWEMQARIFVDVLDAPSRLAGRPIFLDYATDLGALGMPAAARTVITVGAANRSGQPEPFSTAGPAFSRALQVKPNVLAYDQLRLVPAGNPAVYGSAIAAPFAAGQAALSLPARNPRCQWEWVFQVSEPSLLRTQP